MPVDSDTLRASALIDLAAIAHNVQVIRKAAGTPVLAVVKADGYGHGAVPVAHAAVRAGAHMLGVATLAEALELRVGGIGAPLLTWLWHPEEDISEVLTADVDIAVPSVAHLRAVARTAVGYRPRLHLKVDTGLGRGGASMAEWAQLCQAAAELVRVGQVEVVGIMSHLACADVVDDPSVTTQTAEFRSAQDVAAAAGLQPRYLHLANSPGTFAYTDTRFNLVRCGIAVYGLDPISTGGTADLGTGALRPAMTLRSRIALVKNVPAGQGVSYGLSYRTAAKTTLALVPLGYADGIPRAASSRGEVQVRGRRYRIAGRIAMDQFVIDVGNDPIEIGDEVTVFGPGTKGEPTAAEWASYCDTIHYEIVTRIGQRVPRMYAGTLE